MYEAALEVLEEMRGQLAKEMARIDELRKIRDVDPGEYYTAAKGKALTVSDTFYMVENEPALEGVDVATNATTQASAFTRYTVAPTTVFSQSTRVTGWAVRLQVRESTDHS